MNKKISIPIVPIIVILIVLIIIIVAVFNGTQNQTSKLSKIYEKMIANQTYSFTRYDFEEKNKLITYRTLDKTLIDMYNSGEHTSILIDNGDTYVIVHENKEYFIYTNTSEDERILEDDLRKITSLEHTKGKEKIYGKTYKYEEYEGVSVFLNSTSVNIDADSIKTRFYFKGKELVYLKTMFDIVDDETGVRTQEEELQTIKIEYKVDNNLLKIPADYAEI